jgi:hypothetical protein
MRQHPTQDTSRDRHDAGSSSSSCRNAAAGRPGLPAGSGCLVRHWMLHHFAAIPAWRNRNQTTGVCSSYRHSGQRRRKGPLTCGNGWGYLGSIL